MSCDQMLAIGGEEKGCPVDIEGGIFLRVVGSMMLSASVVDTASILMRKETNKFQVRVEQRVKVT